MFQNLRKVKSQWALSLDVCVFSTPAVLSWPQRCLKQCCWGQSDPSDLFWNRFQRFRFLFPRPRARGTLSASWGGDCLVWAGRGRARLRRAGLPASGGRPGTGRGCRSEPSCPESAPGLLRCSRSRSRPGGSFGSLRGRWWGQWSRGWGSGGS